jgi:integrase
MLGTGVRIVESLAVLWEQIDSKTEDVEVTHTIIRVRGQSLIRKTTKSAAGERRLTLPPTVVAMLRRRFVPGTQLDRPVFPDSIGGFLDGPNVRRDIRNARRGEETLAWLTSHTFRKTTATVLDAAGIPPVSPRTSSARPAFFDQSGPLNCPPRPEPARG